MLYEIDLELAAAYAVVVLGDGTYVWCRQVHRTEGKPILLKFSDARELLVKIETHEREYHQPVPYAMPTGQRSWSTRPPSNICADRDRPEVVKGLAINAGDFYATHRETPHKFVRTVAELVALEHAGSAPRWAEAQAPLVHDHDYVILRGRRGRALRDAMNQPTTELQPARRVE